MEASDAFFEEWGHFGHTSDQDQMTRDALMAQEPAPDAPAEAWEAWDELWEKAGL